MNRYLASIGFCALFLYACTNAIQPPSAYIITQKIDEDAAAYTLHQELPQLRGITNGALQKIVNEKLRAMIDDQKENFLNDIPSIDASSGAITKSGLTVTYKTSTVTDDLLSLVFVSSPYIVDAAHPNHVTVSFNYDLLMKKQVFLNDLFAANDYLDQLSTLAVEKLIDQSRASGTYYPGKEDMIKNGAAGLWENYDVFSVEDGQLVFHFDPYQVGPYAEGIQTVRFSRQEIDQQLSELGKSLLR